MSAEGQGPTPGEYIRHHLVHMTNKKQESIVDFSVINIDSVIVTVVLGTMCTRFLPFLVFPESKQPPRIIEYFGQVLPYAMTGLLVVYALRNTPILTGSHGLPELIACTVIVLLHVWKRNMLLSIAGGTIVYMLLVQLVF